MKIATNYEINNKQEMLKRRIREGEGKFITDERPEYTPEQKAEFEKENK